MSVPHLFKSCVQSEKLDIVILRVSLALSSSYDYF